jgi:hypothetical protein
LLLFLVNLFYLYYDFGIYTFNVSSKCLEGLYIQNKFTRLTLNE